MENYIVLNGKRTELTEEQLKELGIIMEKKSPFERVKKGGKFFFIDMYGEIQTTSDEYWQADIMRLNVANYCTDKELLQQQAYRETLNRLLWRYSMEHGGDKINWNDNNQCKHYISYSYATEGFYTNWHTISRNHAIVYFHTIEIAESAIKVIIEPFLKEHPDFKW